MTAFSKCKISTNSTRKEAGAAFVKLVSFFAVSYDNNDDIVSTLCLMYQDSSLISHVKSLVLTMVGYDNIAEMSRYFCYAIRKFSGKIVMRKDSWNQCRNNVTVEKLKKSLLTVTWYI